ncbi:MAG: nitrilase-related carbon-nitrogen hydrolase [Bacteroidota bacterium]
MNTFSKFYFHLFLTAISGVLCILAFPPFDYSFLIWICYTPFLFSIFKISSSKKNVFGKLLLNGLLFGMIFFYGSLNWMHNLFGIYSYILIIILCFYPLIFSLCLGLVLRKKPNPFYFILASVLFWISIEFFKSEGWRLKFSWLNPGYTQHNCLPILQFASVLGQYGLSALIIFSNSALTLLLFSSFKTRTRIIFLFTAILFAVTIFLYGNHKLDSKFNASISVGLIQAENSDTVTFKRLCNKLPESSNFVIFPEYAFRNCLDEDSTTINFIKHFPFSEKTWIVACAIDRTTNGTGFYNTAYLLSKGEIFGRYYKNNPVQFVNDGFPGNSFPVFQTDFCKAGILICYDMDYSYVSRNLTKNGAEILLIPTLDAMRWSETQHIQHSAMTSMRAVENGRFIARAASSGISQIIDPNGKLLFSIPIGKTDVVSGKIMPISDFTFYTLYGYLFPYLCIFGSLILIIATLLSKKIFSTQASPPAL